MGQAYTPGLKVTTDTLLKQRRVLPLRGEVMVQANTCLLYTSPSPRDNR